MFTNRRWSVQIIDDGIEWYCEHQGYNTAYKFNGTLGGCITKVALEK